ncbi:MAG: 30S ribosomal protein S6 [Pseudanabaenaceae cyanobacterium SKYGB_i_bin29]|nr:30S ribosomal protein S6 [Pseudanabaenaceae cyanobacterium SKYG29]MDW8421211.1 30S ribosomal protein S6 [Pseudanabaenaceae cyanobacterium SKYGB_i_bin29]
MNRLYETMYIIRPDLPDPDVEAVINKYQTLLQENQQQGDYIIVQNRGKRRMEYKIKKHREGIYVQMNYSGPPTIVAALEKMMRIDENVLRFLTLSRELEDLADNEKPPALEVPTAQEVTPVAEPAEVS